MRNIITLLVAALICMAAPASASESGRIIITIQNHACSDAPSVLTQSETYNVDCLPETNVHAAAVEIVMSDGFRVMALYATAVNKGLCVTMMDVPAHKHCGLNEFGKALFEGNLLLVGFAAYLNGMSPGDAISFELAKHYGQDHPRLLPVLTNVTHTAPIEKLDGIGLRTASQVVLLFDLTWVEGG